MVTSLYVAHDTTVTSLCSFDVRTDNAIIVPFSIDSVYTSDSGFVVINTCGGDTVLHDTAITPYSYTTSSMLGMYTDTVHSYSYMTYINAATFTTTIVSHSATADTVVTHFPIVACDTTAFICGSARMRDSMVVTRHQTDSIKRTDSSALVRFVCNGDTASYPHFTHFDTTALMVYFDTVHHVTGDTLHFAPDTLISYTSFVSFDTTVVGSFSVVHHDTSSFMCGITFVTDSFFVKTLQVDSVYTHDLIRTVVNHCTGFIMFTCPPIATVATTTIRVYDDTAAYVYGAGTITYPPDTSATLTYYTFGDTLFAGTTVSVTADISGGIITTDSAYTTMYSTNTITEIDSTVIIRNHCLGTIMLDLPFVRYDTTTTGAYTHITHHFSSTTTSVNMLEEVSVKVFPNPFTNEVTIAGPDFISAKLSGINGQQIETKSGFQKVTFDTKNLASGMYLVSIQTNGGQIEKKLVK